MAIPDGPRTELMLRADAGHPPGTRDRPLFNRPTEGSAYVAAVSDLAFRIGVVRRFERSCG
jgi:hypothetical protein